MKETNYPTICHCLVDKKKTQSEEIALIVPKKKEWKKVTQKEYLEQIKHVAISLKKLGVKEGDRVGIMASTRHEWAVCDFAIMAIGAVTIPIYPNSTNDDFEFMVNDSQMKFLFVENRNLFKQWLLIRDRCPQLKTVVGFEKVADEDPQLLAFSSFFDIGDNEIESHHNFAADVSRRKPEEVATIVYTSGTTGRPKGVVLTHEQILSQVSETFASVGIHNEDTTLCFLPFSHVLGRSECWGQMYVGYTMAFAESIEKLKSNLTTIKPTILVSVPRIFEKFFTAIIAQSETSAVQKNMFDWAISIGQQYETSKLTNKKPSAVLDLKYQMANKMVLSKIRNAFGGRVRFAVSGGAPLAKEIADFFFAAGVLLLEGYGLTETTGAIFANRPWNCEFGTVGKPIGEVQIRFAEDGEILIKSKKVMKEYFNAPQDTQFSLKDGWYHTGDIGEFTERGNLKITDRKKDLIKTAGGKYVAPQKLEGLIKQLPFISNVHIHGDQKKYVVALLTLEKKYMFDFAKENLINIKDLIELKDHPKVQELVRSGIASVNAGLASYESIKKFTLLPHDFTIEAGELTPSLKVKRKVLETKYKELIDQMY